MTTSQVLFVAVLLAALIFVVRANMATVSPKKESCCGIY